MLYLIVAYSSTGVGDGERESVARRDLAYRIITQPSNPIANREELDRRSHRPDRRILKLWETFP